MRVSGLGRSQGEREEMRGGSPEAALRRRTAARTPIMAGPQLTGVG